MVAWHPLPHTQFGFSAFALVSLAQKAPESSAGLWDGLISHSQQDKSEHQTSRASYLECGPQTSRMALLGAFSQVTLRLT